MGRRSGRDLGNGSVLGVELDCRYQGLKCEAGLVFEPEELYGKETRQSDWGKPELHAGPVVPTSFDEVVKKLRLSPSEYEGSTQLKEWARKNKDQKYIPDDLLRFWGFEVKGDP